ncbi:MAG TPA: Ig-like domain repeat protein [Candidatus Sulfotelmatobacter sp.]|nr:Ig-like domain repeat protein [Candidatus Sulfotelmatobacter sp.]
MLSQRTPRLEVLRVVSGFIAVLSVITVIILIAPMGEAQAPVPFINLPLVPDATAPGGTDFTLTVSGTGFVSGSVVRWNGSPRPTTFISNSQLKAGISAADIATAGTASVTVVNSAPGGGTSNVTLLPVTDSTGNSVAFTLGPFLTAGDDPNSIAVGDFNADGNLDLAVANVYSGTSSIFLGDGKGNFTLASTPATGASPSSVAVGDFNGDGKLDLAVADLSSGAVAILLGDGKGNFALGSSATAGGYSISVVSGDFNGDGKVDLAVSNYYSNTVSILLGDGMGNFTLTSSPATGSNPALAAVGDLNGDGKLDLAVPNCGSNTVSILLGDGKGNFVPASSPAVSACPLSVAAGDFNRDGKLDLAVANEGGTASILLGDGMGNFALSSSPAAGANPRFVAIGDFNADGNPDLAFADYTGSTVSILLGDGTGNFSLASSLFVGSNFFSPVAVAIGDFNGDGKLDLAVADFNSNTVSILLNNSSENQNPTTTALAPSLNPSVYGQVVTFTAQVTSSSGTPTGTVQVLNGSTVVGSGTLVSGSVSIPISTLSAGNNSITGSYLGGGGFAASKSAPLTQRVTVATTTTSLTSSLNPAGTNQAVTFTSKVMSQYGGAASGTVTFMAGSQNLGSASLSGNIATLTTSFATAGNYSITAQYAGDSNNTVSISPTLSEKIITSTTTALVSSLNPSVVGQAVTFTATVSSSAGTPPNGETITFRNGAAVLGTAPLSGGMASLTTSSLSAGTYTITASYPGDSKFAASTSAGLRQVVNSTTKSPTTTTLASSLNPSIYGQKVTWTATVTTTDPVPPTGTVGFNWSDGFRTFNIGSATLNSSGVATLTRSNLNADPYPLTAKYQGDANNLTSTSPILNQTVLQATSAATITSLPNPSILGQAVTFTAKITSPTVTATGPVTFTIGKTVLASVQLSGGKATFTTSSLPLGSSVVTVTFNGSSNITKSSASVTQVVQQ